ncbi:MAG: Holliday junction resolvase RuvX [Myxococcales bacterium]|nr:MAG: Holliday junction resolvase RuvX [Myxococcales bacterium]
MLPNGGGTVKPLPVSFLGIDYGSKRVGLALAENAELVLPLKTLARGKNFWEELKTCIFDYEVDVVVLGLPLNMDGSEGDAAKRTRIFSDELQKHINVQVMLWDERLSSVEAHDRLDQAGFSSKKQRQVVDQMAAVIILQSFLDGQTQS